MKTLIIDNYDSFTYILKQYVGQLGGKPEVFFHDKITIAEIKKLKPTHIILSPGPGTVDEPKDVGIMFDVIKEFYKTIPILGVCLGHQAICKFFGGTIVRAPKIMHGKRSKIYFKDTGGRKQKTAEPCVQCPVSLFEGIHNPFEAMRYHSLIVDTPFWMNDEVDTIAHTSDFLIMGVKHNKYPVFGVQFHPESLGTKE
ncbi:aminodeoxychorismate/anthranilate synthase component II, partial [Patescibacteria group bacterium]|nr:aminodeoxychorismate/anthranilate synthase component II [Patescibacteria group bacterium]